MTVAPIPTARQLVLIGCGATGQALLRMLRGGWQVIAIDKDAACEAALEALVPWEFVAGDGTSRVVLERAGVRDAAAALITTADDDVNYEAARLAIEAFGIPKVLVLAHWPKNFERLRELGAIPISSTQSLAALLLNALAGDAITATGIGLGQGELVEVGVHPQSHFDGLILGSLRTAAWRIAAIYRDEQLQIPTGRSRIRAGDRLLLVGLPEVLRGVTEMARSQRTAFPLEFGASVLMLLPQDVRAIPVAAEGLRLIEQLPVPQIEIAQFQTPSASAELPADWLAQLEESLTTMGKQVQSVQWGERWFAPLRERLMQRDYGLIIAPELGGPGLRHVALHSLLLELAQCPVLFARGTTDYRRILVPMPVDTAPRQIAEIASSLAQITGTELTLATIITPAFISGDAARESRELARSIFREVAALRHVALQEISVEGNPVRKVLQLETDNDLLLLTGSSRRWALMPDVLGHLLRRSRQSILVLPRLAQQAATRRVHTPSRLVTDPTATEGV